jgi:hypothetical protein
VLARHLGGSTGSVPAYNSNGLWLRRFPGSSGTITITINGDQITVQIDRRAYPPVLRQAALPPDTTIPWWHGRRLHFEFS